MERMDDVFVQNSTSAVRQFQLSDLMSVGRAELATVVRGLVGLVGVMI